MLNIGLSELIVIFFVGFIFVGPKDMPKVVKTIVKSIRKIRGMYSELKAQSGWEDMIKEIDEVKDATIEPIESAKKEITGVTDKVTTIMEEIKK